MEPYGFRLPKTIKGGFWEVFRLGADLFKVVLHPKSEDLEFSEMDTIHKALMALGFTSDSLVLVVFNEGVSFSDAYRVKAGQISCKAVGVVPRNSFQAKIFQLLSSVTRKNFPVFFFNSEEEGMARLPLVSNQT